MLTGQQLTDLLARPVSNDDAAALAVVALPTAEQAAADPGADAAAIAPWLASIGIEGPPLRVGNLSRKIAAALREAG